MVNGQRRRASSSNRLGMLGIALVVTTLLCVLLYQSNKLEVKNTAYEQQIVQLNEQIDAQKARAEEIESLPEYTESKEYIEKVAREKFGLVYDDEIVFRPEQ